MAKPRELYQIQQIRSNSVEDLQALVRDINQQLLEIAQRLSRLSIPQSTSAITTVAGVLTLLQNAGIGEE